MARAIHARIAKGPRFPESRSQNFHGALRTSLQMPPHLGMSSGPQSGKPCAHRAVTLATSSYARIGCVSCTFHPGLVMIWSS